MTERLIKNLENIDTKALEDILYVMARTVETSLIDGGAEPGKDYKILDCYKLAQPFALDIFQQKNKILDID